MFKVRMQYSKTGRMAYVSHLDLMKTMQRSFLRAGLNVRYSQGFNPHIVLSVLVPSSTGHESLCDLCDFELEGDSLESDIPEKLNRVFPEGMRADAVWTGTRPAGEIGYCAYEMEYPAYDGLKELFSSSVTILKKSKRGEKEVDICAYIHDIDFEKTDEGSICRCVLKAGEDTLNPAYITQALEAAGLIPENTAVRYVRTGILDKNCQKFC